MTKKPVSAGPADKVAVLAAVARKIQRILDDNEMIIDVREEGGLPTTLVGSWSAETDGHWIAATLEANPHIVVIR